MINERKTIYCADEPVASVVKSILSDEWDVQGEFTFTVILTHRVLGLQLMFRQEMFVGMGPKLLEVKGEPWMDEQEKQYVLEEVNEWLRRTSKERNKAQLNAERNKFMVLVNNGETK